MSAAAKPPRLRARERPLAGISVLVPRAAEQAPQLSERIRRLGGEVVEAATIVIGPGNSEELAAALAELAAGAFTAVCFTSPNG
ncbi:MAG: uroporphyrinogen-III synthase, partial [Actinomycetota bacterium]|nr:uroporphyrinogen-III synthase [Actinomycetota bacterium]